MVYKIGIDLIHSLLNSIWLRGLISLSAGDRIGATEKGWRATQDRFARVSVEWILRKGPHVKT